MKISLFLCFAIALWLCAAVPASAGSPEALSAALAASMPGQDDWGWGGGEKGKDKDKDKDKGTERGSGGSKGSDWGSGGEGEEEPGPGELERRPALPPEEEGGSPELKGKGTRASLSVWFLGALPLSGEAGSGDGAPGWADAFGFGFGGGAALELRLLPCFGARLSVYYESLPASSFQAFGVDNLLTDFSFVGLSLGPRIYFLLDRPPDLWFGPSDRPYTGLAPFLGYDFGIGFSSAVSWEEPAPPWDYWKSGIILVQEFVLGAEYRLSGAFGAFLELGLATSSGPPAASGVASPLNEAGSLTALRFRVGLLIAF